MKYLDYRENKQQGTIDFPVAIYHVEESHSHYRMPCHWHPEYEIIRILEGIFQLTVDGHLLIAEKNAIIFIQGGKLHGGVPENCIYECFVFDLRLLLSNNRQSNKLISQLLRHDILVPLQLPNEPTSLIQAADRLFLSMLEQRPGYELIIQSALYELFGGLYEAQLLHNNTARPCADIMQIKRLKDVISYIEEHYSEPVTLEDMSGIAGLNPRYFCRFFKRMTQYTPTQYLNYYRIECACDQLCMQHSITEAALNCGFNDISYFIKAFHKAKGITPGQYKEATKHTEKGSTKNGAMNFQTHSSISTEPI